MFDNKVDTVMVYGSPTFEVKVRPTRKRTVKAVEKSVVIKVKKRRHKYINSSFIYQEYQDLRKTAVFWVWWKRQYARQRALCYYCKGSFKTRRVNVEHIVPMSRGGTNNKKNMVLSCADCNKEKGSNMLPKKLRSKLKHELGAQIRHDTKEYRYRQKAQAIIDDASVEYFRENF